MKILMINTVATEKNGITNVIMNIISNIKGEGILFDLLSPNKPSERYTRIVEQYGGSVFVSERSMRKSISYFFRIKKIISDHSYDAIHIHGNSHLVILELLAAFLTGCKIRIVHAHNTTCNFPFVHKLLSPIFNILCTHRIACGNDAGYFMYGKKKFVVFNNGIDTDRFAFNPEVRKEIREKYNIQEKIVIGHVGMFNEAKNQLFLIDVLKKLLQKNSHYCLLFIGEGELMDATRKRAEDVDIADSVFFVGGTDSVPDYLSAMDMIMMPSLFEGLPLALIEEQANGLTCLVSNNITREVDKTGHVLFLPINMGVDDWVRSAEAVDILENREFLSADAVKNITCSGYSISHQIKMIKDCYLVMAQEDNKKRIW